jgi:hypothetical protein
MGFPKITDLNLKGDPMDVTAAVAAISDGGTAVAAIGAASLILVVGIKVWKRLRGAA